VWLPGQADAFAAGKDLGKYIVDRFAKPVVDDPGLPIADALVCISSTVFFATVILAAGAPRPSWLVAAPWVPKWSVRPSPPSAASLSPPAYAASQWPLLPWQPPAVYNSPLDGQPPLLCPPAAVRHQTRRNVVEPSHQSVALAPTALGGGRH
jgi:hypothetical protein